MQLHRGLSKKGPSCWDRDAFSVACPVCGQELGYDRNSGAAGVGGTYEYLRSGVIIESVLRPIPELLIPKKIPHACPGS